MNMSRFAATHRPIVLVFALLALMVGADTFLTMSRREDPKILIRNALVETRWPGASAQKMEELVTTPLEDAVYRLEEVKKLKSTSRVGYSRIEIELEDSVFKIDQVWDDVRAKVAETRGRLPQGCGAPFVNSDFGDVSAVCLTLYQTHPEDEGALHGGSLRSGSLHRGAYTHDYSYRELEIFAEDLETALKAIDSVGQVTIYGAPKEVISLEVDSADWAKIGLTREQLAQALDARNLASGGAEITTADGLFPLHPTGELLSVDEIQDVIVAQRSDGLPVKIGDLPIEVMRGAADPMNYKVRFAEPGQQVEPALMIGVTMKSGRNVVEMGEQIEAVMAGFRKTRLPPDVGLSRINDLPRQVDGLVSNFVTNLWQAIAIVLGVALLMMGWRPAIVMATAVPLCMISCFGVVKLFGVELEQFSIASLIISLGMIVDNAIVVSDNAQKLIDEGKQRLEAVIEGAGGLATPILTSTLTTVAAFMPMLTIPGSSGEYMRSLPIVVSTTLLISYVVAMTVTPVICFYVLRPSKKPASSDATTDSGFERLIRWCLAHKLPTLGGASAAFVLAMMLVPSIGSQFFPQGRRDQLFVHVNLPEGSPLEATEAVLAQVEQVLLETSATELDGERVERLVNATSLVGFGGPRLMLTMAPEPSVRNYGVVLVNTRDDLVSEPWAAELRERLSHIPGALIEVRLFALGPPISNPIEYRLVGDDLAAMSTASRAMVEVFRSTPGALEPNQNWGNAGYEVELVIDDDRAGLAGVSSKAIASTLRDLYGGGLLSTYREGDHQVDIVLRMRGAERDTLSSLEGVYVNGSAGKVPLVSVARLVTGWQPAVIGRQNKRRTVIVGSQVAPGFLPNEVAAAVAPALQAIVDALPPGHFLEVGGEAEETAKSQADIMGALQISMMLILLVLIVQYNSVAKPVIVLLAVPLSLIGALLGLYFSGWPIGFMPSLGIVSLAGVVINNAIILVDFIESSVASGMELRDAVARAGRARMKPILLTTLTTIGGLLPLALFGGPMWAGMSYAMIGGLILSTGLTLLVVPTVYVLFAERFGMKVTS